VAGDKLAWALRAHYNSKLWNQKLREVQDPGGNCLEEMAATGRRRELTEAATLGDN
jgi:hypothetical protein